VQQYATEFVVSIVS